MMSISLLNSIYFNNKKKVLPSPTTPYQSSNLILWLDAMDPCGNSTTISSNTTLSRWIDKSGYNNNAIALTTTDLSTTISYQTTGFNSKPTFNFVASNASRLAGPFNTGSPITGNSTRCFIVGSLNNSSGPYARMISFSKTYKQDDYLSTDCWTFARQTGTGLSVYRSRSLALQNPTAYDTPLIWEGWFDGSNANMTYLNGSSTTTTIANSTVNFAINFYALGNNTGTSDSTNAYLTGKISEVLVYKGTLTTEQVQQTEAYLAYKWGLQATLPSNSPYK